MIWLLRRRRQVLIKPARFCENRVQAWIGGPYRAIIFANNSNQPFMHQLILMRHAKAERARAGLADHERALTPEGGKAAAAMGSRLHAQGVAPDVVLVSSARRTRETLEAIGAWEDQPNIEVMDGLYMAPCAQLRDIIRELRETVRSVLVVGHNPGIHDLAVDLARMSELGNPVMTNPAMANPLARSNMLASLRREFPTACFAEYLVLTPWRDLKPAAVRLQRYLGPQASS